MFSPRFTENLKPDPEVPSPVDPPGDFFRARLVCTLLDTCGQFFDTGTLRTKLDVFLVYFQRYLLAKGPRTHDAEFMVQDSFEQLRPKLTFFKTYEEANNEVEQIEIEAKEQLKGGEEVEERVRLSRTPCF